MSRTDESTTSERPAPARWSELFRRAAGARARRQSPPPPTLFRWDLDKTYLRTQFDHLRDLVRVPFEKAADKVDVPGVAELIRAIRENARCSRREARIFFISASPPQIARAIHEKFALDGVEIDGIVFKDQLQILMRGRFRGLREQTGFKLTELLRGRIGVAADAPEYLFGDDWESDPIIYSLYADALAGRVGGDELERILAEASVDREWRRRIGELLGAVEKSDAVRRIFIHLERQRPPATFHGFGARLVPAFNYFQTAACLYEQGEVGAEGAARVARALAEREGYSAAMLENSLDDVARRGHVTLDARDRLAAELRQRGVLGEPTRARRRLAERLRDRWRRHRAASRRARVAAEPLDYAAIVRDWRALK